MTTISDEMLMAYADGELSPEERRKIDQRLIQEPALRVRLAPFVETRERLGNAFDPVLDEPVPQRLLDAVRGNNRMPLTAWSTPVLQHSAATPRKSDRRAFSIFAPGFSPAMAACMMAILAVGAAAGWIAGTSTKSTTPTASLVVHGSGLVAEGALANALETQPSLSLADPAARETTIVPVLSFRTADNSICREYRMREATSSHDYAGLACRAPEGGWRINLHVETAKQSPSGGGTYATASANNVPAVDTLVETMAAGEVLDGNEEGALIAHNWGQSSKK